MIVKNDVGGITLFDIKVYYKAIVIKIAWYWKKQTHILMEQIENHDFINIDKGVQNIQWSKDNLFNESCWGN